ncbi:MAG: IS4 family transposase [Actinobacteria bacterium]|nr:IS4 family transposase [Actinomycetota bacterium]
MNLGATIFSQLMDHLPMHEFRRCVERYAGSYKVQSFSCWDQFLCMAFAQLTYRESLRDIVTCLSAQRPKLYHMGFRSRILARSTLSYANNTRDWRIYRDFAQVLIGVAHDLYRDEPFGVELSNTAYAFDSTTIDLCLSLFPWATFRRKKAAVKLHTLLNLRGNIPSFLSISQGNLHDVNLLDELLLEPGSIYVLDKAYVDFERLYLFTQSLAYFVIRAKSNLRFHRIYSHVVDKRTGTRCDQTIRLSGFYSAHQYPERLRRIKYYDQETDRSLVFLTNNFLLSSLTIAQLYKCRWQIELFFKWIKQHLRIKAFYGTSENAVRTQIWIAVSVYVLVAILKKRFKSDHRLYTILQILSISLFEKTPIDQALTTIEQQNSILYPPNQLNLFEL